MMKTATQNTWLQGFKIGNRADEAWEICHLLYAADRILFYDATPEQISYLKVMLVF